MLYVAIVFSGPGEVYIRRLHVPVFGGQCNTDLRVLVFAAMLITARGRVMYKVLMCMRLIMVPNLCLSDV